MNAALRISRRAARWVLTTVAAVLMVAAPRVAWAHAHLVRSDPASGARLALSPTLIKLWYSEAAEATMTTISITGSDGSRASLGAVKVDPNDPLLLVAAIESSLPAGKYTVNWRTVAKDDGHPSSGSFSFVVANAAPGTVGATATGASVSTGMTGTTRGDSAHATSHATPSVQAMDVEAATYVLARWLNFVALITVVGAAAFVLLVLPRVDVQNDADSVRDFEGRAMKRAATLGLAAGIAFLIAAVWRLYAEHAVVGGGVTTDMILSSFWGHVWIAQFVIAVIVCVAFALARGSRRGGLAWLTVATVAVALAATPAFSGHAIAAPGNKGISVALDVIHVIAAGAWLGGLLTLTVVGVPAALAVGVDAGERGRLSLVARLVNAFSPLALVFAALVVASGVIAAWMRIGSFGALFHSTYGTVLLIKVGLVILVLGGGAFNWLRMRGALAHRETGGLAVGTFRRSAWIELTAGVLVIAVTAVLVAAQPPVH
jgi:copper transport protein